MFDYRIFFRCIAFTYFSSLQAKLPCQSNGHLAWLDKVILLHESESDVSTFRAMYEQGKVLPSEYSLLFVVSFGFLFALWLEARRGLVLAYVLECG